MWSAANALRGKEAEEESRRLQCQELVPTVCRGFAGAYWARTAEGNAYRLEEV